ncbi:helicase [Cellvibrio sp. KY-GH-1]|uniref:helicase n=1 Tax=Cellvibrio sp. KY-GH-1 TaxID=2303332 RepID=UPI00177E570B|nr:helicase [Cellvibrio sp. KY-GH-1]
MRSALVVVGLLFAVAPALADGLKPFTTDGCSVWIDGPPDRPNLWRHCCVAHDLAYWIGGTRTERKQADQVLKQCIKDAEQPLIADPTYHGVRLGGGPYWPSTYRWGYGWDFFSGSRLGGRWVRGYQRPSAAEQAQIDLLKPAALLLIEEDARRYPADAAPHSMTRSSNANMLRF